MASSARIDELRKKFDENPRRYFAPLANEYRKAGEIEQAIAICREYLPQQPGHMSGHIVFGQALYESRQFEEAKAVFETALSLDPENLIALRHLGDIALILADTEGARSWYRRVLEADPRNEEIQAQLAKLDQAASEAPTPAVSSAVDAQAAASPESASAPPPEPPATSASQPPASPVTATSPTAELVLEDFAPPAPAPASEPAPAEASAVTASAPVPAAAATVPAAESGSPPQEFEIAPTAIADASDAAASAPSMALEGLEATSAAAEAPALDTFSLDGLETTSMAGEPAPTPAPPAVAATPDPQVTSAGSPLVEHSEAPLDLDLGSLGAPETAAPSTEMRQEPEPMPVPPPAVASAPEPEPMAEIPALDLEIPATDEVVQAPRSEAPVSLEPVPAVPDLDIDQTTEAPPLGEARTSPPAETEAPSHDDPFVTETMAELYLRQGHRDEALRVYDALVAQRPDDVALREKVAQLREPTQVETTHPTEPSHRVAAPSGPTIRSVLNFIALRRPGYRPEPLEGNGSSVARGSSAAHDASPASATPAPAERVAAPHAGMADALASEFGFPPPGDADESAAQALAGVFTSNGRSHVADGGAPARPAGSELTLDSVFRGGEGTEPAEAPPAQRFSFDQFFSQRASAEFAAGAESGEQGGAAESQADVAQFTQWLEGLKRR